MLVVDDDLTARRLLRLSLEFEGANVSEAASLADARGRLGGHFDGVVLDRRLPDGDGLELLPVLAERHPQASVVVCSNVDDHAEPWFVLHVPKTDMESVVSVLGLARREQAALPIELRLGASLAEIVRRWIARLGRQLANPPAKAAHVLITQLVHAIGPAGAFVEGAQRAEDAPDERERAEATVRQLVDLRELITDEVGRQLNRESRAGVLAAVNREVDHWILAVVGREVERPARGRHRRLDRAAQPAGVRRGARPGGRPRRPVQAPVQRRQDDLDGLKAINDREGHAAGDAPLVARRVRRTRLASGQRPRLPRGR